MMSHRRLNRRTVVAGMMGATASLALPGRVEAGGPPPFATVRHQFTEVRGARPVPVLPIPRLGGGALDLTSLRGKVVLVNFWATWCPPCRKEMPDLQALQKKFDKQGLVILGITDEEQQKVKDFLSAQPYEYAILFDPNHDAAKQFGIEGIPKSYVYDRNGKLVAQSIDMRTMGQFKAMLAEAGVK
jgi:thiol-disulfide isomerase/thioredoxin